MSRISHDSESLPQLGATMAEQRPAINITAPGSLNNLHNTTNAAVIPRDSVSATQMISGPQNPHSASSESAITTIGSDTPASEPKSNLDTARPDKKNLDNSMNSSFPEISKASSVGSHGSAKISWGSKSYAGSFSSSTYEYSQEPFDTFKHKVIQLCHEIGYGEPLEIERMDGGGFNRIIGLTFATGEHKRCILRIPRFALDDTQPYEISDQVSVLLSLSQYDFLKVPSILAFDMTTKNAIEFQWVLQKRVPGSPLQDIFYDLPLVEKLQVTISVAELVMKLEKIKLDKPGRLIGPRSLPQFSHEPPALLKGVEITGFRKNAVEDQPSLEKQHIVSLLITMFENHRQDELGWGNLAEKYERLQAIVKEMETAGLMRLHDLENVLWHWDLSARNILIDRFDIVGDNLDDMEKEVQSTVGNTVEASTPVHVQTGCSKTFPHSSQFTVESSPGSGHKHSIQIKVQNDSAKCCKHTVQVEIVEDSGTTYWQKLEMPSPEHFNESQKQDPATVAEVLQQDKEGIQGKPAAQKHKWIITGVLDWDDALSIPLVLARKPQSWLWFDEGKRTLNWNGNRDIKPERDLTNDELLIKAHFDQIMAREDPTYIEDAYHRGIWVRALAKFALDGFNDSQDWKRYDKFVVDWDEYLKSTGLKAKDEVKAEAESRHESTVAQKP